MSAPTTRAANPANWKPRQYYNFLVKTQPLRLRHVRMLQPWNFNIDRMVVYREHFPGLIYAEGIDPRRQSDFLHMMKALIGTRVFKVLRSPAQSTRFASLPGIQTSQYPHLVGKPGIPLPPLPPLKPGNWWTHIVETHSIREFESHMRQMGIYGWYQKAILEDMEESEPTVPP